MMMLFKSYKRQSSEIAAMPLSNFVIFIVLLGLVKSVNQADVTLAASFMKMGIFVQQQEKLL